MGLERNSVDGGGATDDEGRRQIEERLINTMPLLRWNRAHLKQLVDAIQKGSAEGWQPSEALNSSGQVHNSDLNQEEGFFKPGGMEDFRKREMGNKSIFPETADPEDDRYFGEPRNPEPNPTAAPVNFPGEISQMVAAGRFPRRRTR